MAKTAREVPRVKVISRHRAECPSKSEGKAYVRCACPKALYWYEDGKERVTSADTTDYQEAERRAFKKQSEFEAVATGAPEHVTITAAINMYLARKAGSGIKAASVEKAALPLRKLEMYLTQKGIVYLKDVKRTDLEAYRASWEGKPVTRSKRQGRIKGFFSWAVRSDIIEKDPALALDNIRGGRDTAPTIALDDEQFNQVMAAMDGLNVRDKDERERFRAVTLLQRWSGLAIQDALMIERARFRKMSNGWYRLFLRRAKTGVDVYVSLAPDVVEKILGVKPVSDRYMFWDGTEPISRMTKTHWKRFQQINAVLDIKDESGHKVNVRSHMFRDTFAVWCFTQGMATEDVAALLGHKNIMVTQQHYSPWIRIRQERLGSIVESAYQAWATNPNAGACPVPYSGQVPSGASARIN